MSQRKQAKKLRREVARLNGFQIQILTVLQKHGITVRDPDLEIPILLDKMLTSSQVHRQASFPTSAVQAPVLLAPAPTHILEAGGLDLGLDLAEPIPTPRKQPAQAAPPPPTMTTMTEQLKAELRARVEAKMATAMSRGSLRNTGQVGTDGQPIYAIQLGPKGQDPEPNPELEDGPQTLSALPPELARAIEQQQQQGQ